MRIMTIYAQASDETRKNLDRAPKEMKAGIKDAVNELAKESREDILKTSRQKYTLRKERFQKSDISLKKAVLTRLEATLSVSGEAEPINKAYRFRKNSVRKGVRAEIKRGNGLKELKMRSGSLKAFVTGVTTGHADKVHKDVFQRKGRERLPIKTIQGPSRAKIAEVLWRDELQSTKGEELTRRINTLAERTLS